MSPLHFIILFLSAIASYFDSLVRRINGDYFERNYHGVEKERWFRELQCAPPPERVISDAPAAGLPPKKRGQEHLREERRVFEIFDWAGDNKELEEAYVIHSRQLEECGIEDPEGLIRKLNRSDRLFNGEPVQPELYPTVRAPLATAHDFDTLPPDRFLFVDGEYRVLGEQELMAQAIANIFDGLVASRIKGAIQLRRFLMYLAFGLRPDGTYEKTPLVERIHHEAERIPQWADPIFFDVALQFLWHVPEHLFNVHFTQRRAALNYLYHLRKHREIRAYEAEQIDRKTLAGRDIRYYLAEDGGEERHSAFIISL